jgi:hypothetical protein
MSVSGGLVGVVLLFGRGKMCEGVPADFAQDADGHEKDHDLDGSHVLYMFSISHRPSLACGSEPHGRDEVY